MKEKIHYWGQLLKLPFYWLSHMTKRDPYLWVMGSTFGKRYADNPRFLYCYLNQMNEKEREELGLEEGKKIRPIWITHNEKLAAWLRSQNCEAYYYLSTEGIRCCLQAGVYLFDNYSKDISFWCSGGAKKINLWHGTPLKKIQMDNKFDKVRHPENFGKKLYWIPRRMSDEKPSHYVLTTSSFFQPIFSSAFATEHVLVCGYPRNDGLLGTVKNICLPGEKRKLEWILKKKEKKNEKIVCYMPTFRESETLFFEVTQTDRLVSFLKKQGITLVIKLHPKSKMQDEFVRQIKEKEEVRKQILLLSKDDDPYEFLKHSDALITDYSSVYFDYLLLNRPVIFYDYDRTEYLSQTRELYFDYEAFTPGRKAKNGEELIKALSAICWEKQTDGYEEKRAEILNYCIDEKDGGACRRLTKAVLATAVKGGHNEFN